MNKTDSNCSVFFARHYPLLDKLQKFYEEYKIKLTFKSVKRYFHFDSYIFSVTDKRDFLKIFALCYQLSEYLNIKVIISKQSDSEVAVQITDQEKPIYDFLDAVKNEEFQNPQNMVLPILLGNHNGIITIDLMKEHHLLITGQIGSGKSIFIHNLILSLLYHHSSETLKLILMTPKAMELSIYNDIPHLLAPIVTDQYKMLSALMWCIDEMERRYSLLSQHRVSNIIQYNSKVETKNLLPYIVIVIDEFSYLMQSYGKKTEICLVKLAQKARDIGIHLVTTTKILTDDVITNLININIPSRIILKGLQISNFTNIFNMIGIEHLSGDGDSLFLDRTSANALRIQTPFVNDQMIEHITNQLRLQGKPSYIEFPKIDLSKPITIDPDLEKDPLIEKALTHIIETENTTASSLQRKFSIGFNRAAAMIEYLEGKGILSAPEQYKRKILKKDLI